MKNYLKDFGGELEYGNLNRYLIIVKNSGKGERCSPIFIE
jgi:hypothetical protein